MEGLGQESAYDELFEPLSLALGHLVFGAAALEKAMLADLVQRRVIRDGAEKVFGQGLVTELERKSAGALLRRLRELGYEESLAERIAVVIEERNYFIHHLYEDPDFIHALGHREGVEKVVSRVEALVARLHEVVKELEPRVTSGMQEMFGCSLADVLDQIRQIDPNDFEDSEERRQLEAIQGVPDDFVGEGT